MYSVGTEGTSNVNCIMYEVREEEVCAVKGGTFSSTTVRSVRSTIKKEKNNKKEKFIFRFVDKTPYRHSRRERGVSRRIERTRATRIIQSITLTISRGANAISDRVKLGTVPLSSSITTANRPGT